MAVFWHGSHDLDGAVCPRLPVPALDNLAVGPKPERAKYLVSARAGKCRNMHSDDVRMYAYAYVYVRVSPCLFVYLSICLSVRPSVRPSVCACVLVCLCMCMCMCICLRLSMSLFVCSFVRSFVSSFLCLCKSKISPPLRLRHDRLETVSQFVGYVADFVDACDNISSVNQILSLSFGEDLASH